MPLVTFVQSELLAAEGAQDRAGVCWALSMKWLYQSLSGKSDEQEQRIAILKRWMPQAIAAQTHYEAVHQGVALPKDIDNPGVVKALALLEVVAARLGGIAIDKSDKKQVLMTMDATCQNVDAIVERLRTPGKGHVLGFQYKNGTGHAMASRARSDGFWYRMSPETFVFDPNAGEVAMNAETLKTYLTNHMNRNGATSLLITKMCLA